MKQSLGEWYNKSLIKLQMISTEHSLTYPESVHWNAGGSCDELQQPRALLVAEGEDEPPEPEDHCISGVVVLPVHVQRCLKWWRQICYVRNGMKSKPSQ